MQTYDYDDDDISIQHHHQHSLFSDRSTPSSKARSKVQSSATYFNFQSYSCFCKVIQ
jgi:hypothetical protein